MRIENVAPKCRMHYSERLKRRHWVGLPIRVIRHRAGRAFVEIELYSNGKHYGCVWDISGCWFGNAMPMSFLPDIVPVFRSKEAALLYSYDKITEAIKRQMKTNSSVQDEDNKLLAIIEKELIDAGQMEIDL